MKAFEITATLLGALAWPIVALIVIFFLRTPLRDIATNLSDRRPLKRAKLGPVEVEWDSLDEARTQAATEDATKPDSGPKVKLEELADAFELAESHPTAAVMLAGQRVEAAVAKALKSNDITPTSYSMYHMSRAMRMNGLLSDSSVKVLNSLRELRNQVMHAHDTEEAGVTPARAADYVATAAHFIETLKRLS
ncbi:hypothetical protein V1634_26970 [Plantactinospora veratri]|uniref:DUF4145 domain-containing protein n=1 Tax=Plantactinospora veratri TaxID=1436122 RepID=A0ABU7SKJ5_9ACTN